jgi:hypothetical protein
VGVAPHGVETRALWLWPAMTHAEWQHYQEDLLAHHEEQKRSMQHELEESRRVMAYVDQVLDDTQSPALPTAHVKSHTCE